MRDAPKTILRAQAVCLALFLLIPRLADAGWPVTAERSGLEIPADRRVVVALEGAGAYVPQVSNLSGDRTGIFEGSLRWNLGLTRRLGLFGDHSATGMWWGDLSLLNLGNEVGVRWLAVPRTMAVEVAYLGHRAETQWIEDGEGNSSLLAVGGVRDHGVEIGSWFRFEPFSRLRLEPHLYGRIFRVYKDNHAVTGLGLRTCVRIIESGAVVLDLDALRVIRTQPRASVERVTWNVIGAVKWRVEITARLGLEVGARLSTNLLVGDTPMLELKRSMIDEPMAMGLAGLFFSI